MFELLDYGGLKGGIIVNCYIFSTFQPFFFIISSRFYEIQKAVIMPVVRGPVNLSEFFSDF